MRVLIYYGMIDFNKQTMFKTGIFSKWVEYIFSDQACQFEIKLNMNSLLCKITNFVLDF